MNPWDNFFLAINIGLPGLMFAFATYLFFLFWMRDLRNKSPSTEFTDDKYEDGFYVQKENRT